MTKREIIKLYLSDLNNIIGDSAVQRNRIEMLRSELETTEPVNVGLADIRRSLWCILGLHKLRYFYKYLHTSKVKCTRKNCKAEFIEGETGSLYRC